MKKAIATALAAVIICLTTACSGQGAAAPDGTREEGLLLNQDYVNALNKEIDFLYHDTSFLNLEYGMDRKSGAIRLYLSKEG